jgi:dephospho-CoA kinase
MTGVTTIIGLTGNIATGKSVVRRMLANSGALGIDADDITHRMLYPESPVYSKVIETFGDDILSNDGQISRSKLGEIVFKDEKKLHKLESLIHPGVTSSIEKRIRKADVRIIVIEAIKLLESDLRGLCDSVWVSHASSLHQMERLMQTRKMDERQAQERISAQPPQGEKLASADVVINTEGTFERTWQQVRASLNDTIQLNINLDETHFNISQSWTAQPAGSLTTNQMENIWNKYIPENMPSLYQHLGMQMVLVLSQEKHPSRLVLWENESFTGTITDVFPLPVDAEQANLILEAFSCQAIRNQCEVIFLSEQFFSDAGIDPARYRFHRCSIDRLLYSGWQETAVSCLTSNEKQVWFKLLAYPVESESKMIFE